MKTAKDWTYHEGILTAQLQNTQGEWIESTVKVSPETSLENDNGKFKKGPKIKLKEIKELPGGDYMKESRNVQHDGNVLKAEMKDETGQWKPFEFKHVNRRDSIRRSKLGAYQLVKEKICFWEKLSVSKIKKAIPGGNWIKKARRFSINNLVLAAVLQ